MSVFIDKEQKLESRIERLEATVNKFNFSGGLALREPDCNATDCYYNHETKCKARPFISVAGDGTCLDYDVFTQKEIAIIEGEDRNGTFLDETTGSLFDLSDGVSCRACEPLGENYIITGISTRPGQGIIGITVRQKWNNKFILLEKVREQDGN